MSGSAKENPPQPLEARLSASVRHPEGLPRCQRWKIRDGGFWQCSKAARHGMPVCGVHGGGYPRREKLGVRENPATVSLRTGERAKPETVEAFFQGDTTIARRFREYLDGPNLMDLRPVVATARAIYDEYVERIAVRGGEDAQSALAAIQGADAIARLVQCLIDIDQRLGPITHSELERVKDAVVLRISKYVDPDRGEEAIMFIYETLRERRGQPTPWARSNRDASSLPKPPSARTW
jgi:hypothetical protein